MRHIFISYHHDDGDFAEVLIDRIEKVGFETWVDNDRLHAGEDWRAEIDQAIKAALALIVIMTPEARSSEYVTYEWAFAWGAGVKVIPVLYKDTKLHPRLEALQYLNFTSRTARPWDDLIAAVKNAESLAGPRSTTPSSSMPPYLTQPIELLNSADPHERRRAVENLIELDHPAAHQALTDALHHPLQDVRIQAAIARAKYKEVQAIPILLEVVCNEVKASPYFGPRDVISSSQAFDALGEMGYAAIPSLIEALHSGDAIIRIIAAEALRQIGNADAIPGLLEALYDKDMDVRRSAVGALGQLRDTRAIPGLLEALHDESDVVRKIAVYALGQIGDTSAVPGLLEALYEEEWYVPESVIKALGQIGDASAVPGLLELLNKDNIKKIGDTKKRIEFYNRQSQINSAVTESIVKIGDSALPYLIDALHHKSWDVRKTVIEILGKIGNTSAVPDLLESLWKEKALRRSAIEALMKIGDANAIPGLLEALHDEDVIVRRSAIEALIKMGDVSAVPSLLGALRDDKDSIIREKSTEALGRIGDASAIPGLLETIRNDDNQEVLRGASKALVKIGNYAVPNLLNALTDDKLSIRHKGIIANTLRQIGTPEALAAIKQK